MTGLSGRGPLIELMNAPMRYAWGGHGQIRALLGTGGALIEPDGPGALEAELWFGAHPAGPTRVAQPDLIGGAANLAEWIDADPGSALGELSDGIRGEGARLPYIMKVLSAREPLSLQAHPTLDEAREGFARENAAGIALDDPQRNFKDPWHKPELILALTPTIEAVCGFRDLAEVRGLVAGITDLLAQDGHADAGFSAFAEMVAGVHDAGSLRELVAWILRDRDHDGIRVPAREDPQIAAAVQAVHAWANSPEAAAEDTTRQARNVRRLEKFFPGDPGVLLILLLNHVSIPRGQAVFVRAGTLHSYMEGLGIEIMAASDNVLRGGITPKHIDVDELLKALVFAPVPDPILPAHQLADGSTLLAPGIPDFQLRRITADDGAARQVEVDGATPTIALCLSGSARVTGRLTGGELTAGHAVYLRPGEGAVTLEGAFDVVLASPGSPQVDGM
ncbi:mannose-6-phosphate isomerase, class I [Acidipropionibacterium virtanenii]|uniref:mannose-6-phosphate isomerase n=1 Tax=Acidipropionibacterium virtanenii TaxID=2057246 RepID=A0A344UXU2_9ACTN|nr:mannose-6-phosphate isomerase, class I [Acidipropionibacterium virtanenii]AXE40090.1 Mannose-6-phosphate isomerase [Acidipropionibacterium virtanenii]